MKIERQQSEEAYLIGLKHHDGEFGITEAKKRLEVTNLNPASAADLVYGVTHLLKGTRYVRSLSLAVTDDYLTWILRDRGDAALANALIALGKHIDYNITKLHASSPGLRKLLSKHQALLTPVTEVEWAEYQSYFIEGRVMEIRLETRQRCERMIEQLKKHFRNEETGLIACACCRWTRPLERIRGDIIHMHHHQPMHKAPIEGRVIPWEDALHIFSPLCPTCHALIHAKSEGGCYELEELQQIIAL